MRWLMTEAWRRERLWRAGDEDLAVEASVASVAVSMSKVRKVILLSLSVVTSWGRFVVATIFAADKQNMRRNCRSVYFF